MQFFLDKISDCQTTGNLFIPDFCMRLSRFTSASSEDAQVFSAEAEKLQQSMCLNNPLPVLFLSITDEISMAISYDSDENRSSNMTVLIDKAIVRTFNSHPDAESMRMIGLDENILNRWVRGQSSVRSDPAFKSLWSRLWSAMFVKEICENPSELESLCKRFGFDRAGALELANAIASRTTNLRSFCNRMEKFWWYGPLAGTLVGRLRDACDDEIRPLLGINHVTIGRAKAMIKMGLRSAKDVASLSSPSILFEKIPFLSQWVAEEMVSDARMNISQGAMELAAESQECERALSS